MKVHVSTLSKHAFCPRAVYLEDVLRLTPASSKEKERGLVGHAIRKELSLRQSKVLGKVSDARELTQLLLAELDRILEDAPRIYREKLFLLDYETYVQELKSQLIQEIGVTSQKLSELVSEAGLERALKLVTPDKVEYTLSSDALNLTGRVDKLMRDGEARFPIEIKTGTPPKGVWTGDRLQVCGYLLLCEEEFSQEIPYGFVEYTHTFDRHPVLASEKLRRTTLETRDKIDEILEGSVPDICPHGSGRKCASCGFKEACYRI